MDDTSDLISQVFTQEWWAARSEAGDLPIIVICILLAGLVGLLVLMSYLERRSFEKNFYSHRDHHYPDVPFDHTPGHDYHDGQIHEDSNGNKQFILQCDQCQKHKHFYWRISDLTTNVAGAGWSLYPARCPDHLIPASPEVLRQATEQA